MMMFSIRDEALARLFFVGGELLLFSEPPLPLLPTAQFFFVRLKQERVLTAETQPIGILGQFEIFRLEKAGES